MTSELTAGLAQEIPPGKDLAGVVTVTTPGEKEGGAVEQQELIKGTLSAWPNKWCESGAEKGGSEPKPASVYIGEGLPPVPGWVVEWIKKWEFIEMHELLPELQDISIWLQYFTVWRPETHQKQCQN